MMIDGEFTVQAPIERVWSYLIDFEQVSLCMPGVDKVEPAAENVYNGVVTVKVGPISTSFKGTVTKTLEQPPNLLQAKLQGRDQNTASMVTGEFTSKLTAPNALSTQVSYQFDVAIRGRLGQFGQAVILDTSRQLAGEFANCVKSRLEQPESASPTHPAQPNVASIAWRAFLVNLWQWLRRLFGVR